MMTNYVIFQMQVDVELQNGWNFFFKLATTSHNFLKQSFLYSIFKTSTVTSWSEGENARLMFSFSNLTSNFLNKIFVKDYFSKRKFPKIFINILGRNF